MVWQGTGALKIGDLIMHKDSLKIATGITSKVLSKEEVMTNNKGSLIIIGNSLTGIGNYNSRSREIGSKGILIAEINSSNLNGSKGPSNARSNSSSRDNNSNSPSFNNQDARTHLRTSSVAGIGETPMAILNVTFSSSASSRFQGTMVASKEGRKGARKEEMTVAMDGAEEDN